MNHRDIKMTLRYMKLAEANKVSAFERTLALPFKYKSYTMCKRLYD